MDINNYYEKSTLIRRRFIELFSELGFGHLTTAFSEAEILIALFEEVMRQDENGKFIDKFVLSKGHGAGMVYPILEDMKIFSKEETESMIRMGGDFSRIREYICPGFEFYGGSLGIGIGMAAGIALGYKQNREDRVVFCLCGDAECYEGSVWEAALFAAHNRLNNLVLIIDRNQLGVSDFTENMCGLEPFLAKWESCNWDVREIDGHSYEELFETLQAVYRRTSSRPMCIIANTIKGKGLEEVSNMPLKHGYMPTGQAALDAIHNLEDVKREKCNVAKSGFITDTSK